MSRHHLNTNSGQLTLEAVLLMVVIVTVATLIFQGFKEREILGSFIQKPWKVLAGMVENGVWDVDTRAARKHPISRRLSYDPEGGP